MYIIEFRQINQSTTNWMQLESKNTIAEVEKRIQAIRKEDKEESDKYQYRVVRYF